MVFGRNGVSVDDADDGMDQVCFGAIVGEAHDVEWVGVTDPVLERKNDSRSGHPGGELVAYQVDRQRLEVARLAFVDSNDVSEESRLLE